MERFYTLGPNQTFVEVKMPTFNNRETFEKEKANLNPELIQNRAKRFGMTFEESANALAEYRADRAEEAFQAAWRASWFGGSN